jgi:hypothetical protein
MFLTFRLESARAKERPRDSPLTELHLSR